MDKQSELIKKFKEVFDDPTYKESSKITGIQHTRMFRIFNGYEMKLSEYLSISEIVTKKLSEQTGFDQVVEKCRSQLSIEVLKRIEEVCLRKLEIHSLLKETKLKEAA